MENIIFPHTDECDEAYYAYDFTKPYACISGSSAIIKACNGDIERAIESYIYLTNLAKKKMQCKIYLVVVDDGDLFSQRGRKKNRNSRDFNGNAFSSRSKNFG